MSLEPGELLNKRYKIVKLLGQGGFGAVYKAEDANLAHTCAVKENLDTSTEAQRQFLREATVLANLSHPNLPRVTDHFVIEGQGQYLVMDFIEGDDINSMIEKDGAMPPAKALNWIHQVMDALMYMHGRNPPVLHRDIKPANIKVTPEGKAVLVDFGLVKLYDSHLRTTVGARAITPGYSPPEQYGQGNTDARTDVYALGATLYMLLTGQHPPESVQRVATDTLRPVHVVNPQVPASLGMTIARAMGLAPTNRFQTMAEFKNALLVAATGQPATIPHQQPLVQPSGFETMPAAAAMPRGEALPPYSYPTGQGMGTVAPAAGKKKSRVGLIIGITAAVVLMLVCVFVVGPLVGLYAIGSSSLNKTATSDALLAMHGTQTAINGLTATADRRSMLNTQEAGVMQTATADALASGVIIFGPSDGSLPHTDDGFIAVFEPGLSVKNFIAEVTFINPYGTSTGSWDYGLLFRHNPDESNQQYRLILNSSGEWEVYNNTGSPDGSLVTSGTLTNFNTEQYGSNVVRLYVQDDYGELYVNYDFISSFVLKDRTNAGDVEVATGLYSGDEIVGYSTDYSGFTVSEIK